MGIRASNIEDWKVNAGWWIVLQEGYDPSEVITIQGNKKVMGTDKWEKATLTGPRWALALISG